MPPPSHRTLLPRLKKELRLQRGVWKTKVQAIILSRNRSLPYSLLNMAHWNFKESLKFSIRHKQSSLLHLLCIVVWQMNDAAVIIILSHQECWELLRVVGFVEIERVIARDPTTRIRAGGGKNQVVEKKSRSASNRTVVDNLVKSKLKIHFWSSRG